MKRALLALVGTILAFGAGGVRAATFEGPGRFCGYSVIIDLKPGETIEPTHCGMHGGGFVWRGGFGELEVSNVGWASKPPGRKERRATLTGQTRFAERKEEGQFVVAIWNRRNGAAYFASDQRHTTEKRQAIDRVLAVRRVR